MKQLLLDIQPPAPPSLHNFIIGNNQEAISNLYAAIQGTAPSRFVYIWGAPGSGKSHLLQAAQALGAHIADDVHLLNDAAQIDLFNRYNQLKEQGETLITAGLYAPTQMDLRDDLATRLAWGLVYQLHPLSDEEKAQALKSHAQERGMRLPDEVVDYCLRYLKRDLPTLMAVLDTLDVWSLTEKKPVTVPMLKKLLQLNLSI